METYDIIILGGGPAGFTAANRAAEKGFKTAIFEYGNLGGVCLNEGCIPSKSFIHSSKEFFLKNVELQTGDESLSANLAAWVDEKNKAVDLLRNGVRGSLRKNKVKIIFSFGSIVSYDNGVTIICDSEGKEYQTDNLILAVGSDTFIPPIHGVKEALDNGFALTTHNIFDLTEDFSSLAIIGGGVIGIELAFCFSMAGKRVEIVEAAGNIGASLDTDAVSVVEKSLETYGVNIYKNAVVSEISDGAIDFTSNGDSTHLLCDKVLICAGRKPRLTGYGLEKISPKLEKNSIFCDAKMRTDKKGVYAVGDINGKSMLAHTAYREAEVCINNIAGENDSIDYNLIPSVLYGIPEVASAGVSINELRGVSGAFVKRVPMLFSGRAVAEGQAKYGFCKLLFDSEEVLVGATIVGEYASEIILALSVMISEKFTLSKMKRIVYPHPSVAEIIREALYAKNEPI